jgi:glycosyltransferase involved in cell wall biosynthesis
MEGRKLRLAYLVSRYPAVSHTFILREILGLRDLGVDIDPASINSADRPPALLTAEERAEAKRTFYVKQAGAGGAIRAHAATLVSRPMGYFRGLWFAMRLGGLDPRRAVMHLFYFIEAVMVGDWMKSRRLRHLHVHFATPAATVGMIVGRIFPFGFSMTVHGPDEFYDVPGYSLAQKVAEAHFICAIGSYARSQLMKASEAAEWAKIEVTPLGVDAAIFAPRVEPPAVDCFEIICVGRLVPAKGQHILLRAIEILRGEGRQVRLRLVGDGPDRKSLEAATQARSISDCVIFEGAVNQDRIRALYEQAHAFALASFAEGIPVVLMEAMAMEIPCVTTWITGIPELIRDSIDGLLVAASDHIALAGALAQLMDEPGLRSEIGKAGRRRVIEKYNLQANVARLADVYRARIKETEA